jgi:M6 family metalloprotease-like protein
MKSKKMFWLYIGIAILVIIFLNAKKTLAVPAAPITYTLSQPNGVKFEARKVGDEWNNRTISRDGYTIVLDESTGYWVYAQKEAGGDLGKSSYRVGIDSPKGIKRGVKPQIRSPQSINAAALVPGKAGSPSMLPPVTTSGNQSVLIILVKFADEIIHTTEAAWNAAVFGTSSSVASYYKEVSYGALNLVPAKETYSGSSNPSEINDGIITVVLPYNHPDTRSGTSDVNRQVTYDALVGADKYINYSNFDTDKNGYISTNELHIVTVIAGYETAYGGDYSCQPSIWGHHWNLGGSVPAPILDGVSVAGSSGNGGYSQIGEMHGIDDPMVPGSCLLAHMATIGIIAHEMGHNLWWPDMYDIDDDDVAGIGAWGIMSYGSWNTSGTYAGDSPAHPSPWERWYSGWITPNQITAATTVSIPRVETNPTVYQLGDNINGVDWSFYGSSGTGEYFLVENRQLVGFDIGLPACGILIWHIDEGVAEDNTCNMYQWGQRLVALEQADGQFHLERNWFPIDLGNTGDAGDPYLAGDSFDATTTPNSNFYTGGASGVSVLVNSACSSSMSVDVDACSLNTFYRDFDGDTYGDANNTIKNCSSTPPAGYVSDSTDCDDADAGVNPGTAEICDGLDNDCQLGIDNGLPANTYYRDGDGDGYGDLAISIQACAAPVGYVNNSDDCDDTKPGVNPGATEICDGIDNDCINGIDDGLPANTYYRDADGDGYGNPSVGQTACSLTVLPGYVNNNTDCDDTDSQVYPGATEVCDGIDNDCDLSTDEGLPDNDLDGICDGIDTDDDNDGMSDAWETANGLDPLSDIGDDGASGDPDGDGFTNLEEYQRVWDPQNAPVTWYVDVKSSSPVQYGTQTYPFHTITGAISAANNGDTILVDTGTYAELINFSGKTLVIIGEGGGEGTVIDAEYLGGPAVKFENGEGPYTELNGFIIRSVGVSASNPMLGGAIAVLNGSSPRIVNNIIVNNYAVYGAGIACNASSPTIVNNTITNNDASAAGDGIYCVNGSSPVLLNTILWNNGNEIYLDNSTITVTYSDVEGGYTGSTNINSDPKFSGVIGGDYHLQSGSPCINAGTSTDAPFDDIDGDIRPQAGAHDIGADEYSASVCTDADGDGYYVEGGNCGAFDCDDTDEEINPGASELCDGVDNNCNQEIDEHCSGSGGVDSSSSPTAAATDTVGGAKSGNGGCFIATAAFGTPMAQQVIILCKFRDKYLLTNTCGRKFVELYYEYSPPLANYIAARDALRSVVRICLIPLLITANFMLKFNLVSKLLILGGLLGMFIIWRFMGRKTKPVLVLPKD